MMKRNRLLVIALVLVSVALALIGCTSDTGSTVFTNNQQEGIWVTGTGKVFAAPDIVSLSLGIEAQEASVAEAQAAAAETMDRVMTALRTSGVADKDIQTQYYSIQQVTRWDRDTQEEVVVGYRVSNMVIAKIREIDKTGSIVDAVAAAGGDLTRINNISFSIDDPSEYNREARDKAMVDAKAKAEQLASLGGVRLGKPIYISESVSYPVGRAPAVGIEEAAPSTVTQISPGELEISLNVQVVYAILK
jgi:uncharacterized protein YggE